MLTHFLRQRSVRYRIIGGFGILLIFLTLSIPLVVVNHLILTNRVRQLENVDARSDRLLLLSLSSVLSSRVNLTRYADDLAPSPSEALSDVNTAIKLLDEARTLINAPDQRTATANILAGLVSYSNLITEVQNARNQGRQQDVPTLLFNAYRIEFDVDQQIRAVVSNSEANVAAANKTALAEAQQRLYLFIGGYVALIILAIWIAAVVQRTITQPIAELRQGAESFRLEKKATSIPHDGTDELSVLAQTFNELSADLVQTFTSLENRVSERTIELEHRTEDLENISNRMKKRADELQAVALVGRTITSVQSLEDLLPRVATVISDQFGFYHVGIFLLDETKNYAVLVAANSAGGQKMLARHHQLKVGEVGIVGYVADSGSPRIALDTGADAIFFNNPDLPQTRSEMALPIRIGREIFGVLDVQSEQPSAFQEEDIELLSIAADQVSIAIQNARRFDETQRAIAAAEATTRQYLQQGWKSVTEEASTPGYIYSKANLAPLPQFVENLAIQQASQSGQTSTQAERGQHHLAVPIKLRGQVVAMLNLQSTSGRAWEEDEIDIAQATADRMALALESARLFDDAQRRASKERKISEITSKISASANVDGILQIAAKELGLAIPDSEVVIQFQTPENE